MDRENGEGQVRHRAFLVEGRVQGVGFRHWTVKNARSLDLEGTVRNRDDGRVEIHARGTADALSVLEDRLHRGPRSARVEGVEEVEPRDQLPSEFRVVY